MNFFSRQTAWGIALCVGAPLLLAVVELFHPHPSDLLSLDVDAWLAVHYAQIALFPLAALAVTALVRHQAGIASVISRVAMFTFAVSFVAFDSAAGVVTGILADAAQKSRSPEGWRAAIDAIWTNPVVGGSPLLAAPFLAVLGSVALSVGTVAAAFALKRAGHSWGPIALLAVSGFGISIFKTHAWPGGPLTFGGIAIAAAWILWERNSQ
jgi:hypothetical protein